MPRPPNPERTFEFTDRKLKSLPPPPGGREKQRDHFDTNVKGLGLRLSYGGKRSFFVMYADGGGKRQRFTLGEYGKIENGKLSLAVGRKKAKAKLGEVATGKSPAAELAAVRQAPVFSDLAADFIAEQSKKKKSWQRQGRILERDVLPEIGGLKARDVTRADIKAMLRKITERPAPVLANRAHEIVRRMFNFAIEEETYGVEHNPAERIERQEEKSRGRWLTVEEISAYWRALDDEPPRAAAALRLLLLTAQRQQNVLAMRGDQIEWNDNVWTCPASETKTEETYVIPLAPMVLETLGELKADANSGWIFEKRGEEAPADRTFIAKPHRRACIRAGIENYTIHDHRHSFATHAARMGISEFIRGRVLHHSIGKTTTAKYTHHDFFEEKRDALCKWADRVNGAISEKVVQLRKDGAA